MHDGVSGASALVVPKHIMTARCRARHNEQAAVKKRVIWALYGLF